MHIHFLNGNSVYCSALKNIYMVLVREQQELMCFGIQPRKAGLVVSVVFWYFVQTGGRLHASSLTCSGLAHGLFQKDLPWHQTQLSSQLQWVMGRRNVVGAMRAFIHSFQEHFWSSSPGPGQPCAAGGHPGALKTPSNGPVLLSLPRLSLDGGWEFRNRNSGQ